MINVTADVFPIHALSLEDAESFIQWAYLMREKTQFNMEIMRHPRMCMTRAKIDGETVLMVPVQPVLMLDALTPDPALTNKQRAISMARISDLLETSIMPATGMYDTYFYTNDDAEAVAAAKYGWVEVKGIRLMRKRIAAPATSETKDV